MTAGRKRAMLEAIAERGRAKRVRAILHLLGQAHRKGENILVVCDSVASAMLMLDDVAAAGAADTAGRPVVSKTRMQARWRNGATMSFREKQEPGYRPVLDFTSAHDHAGCRTDSDLSPHRLKLGT